MIRERTQVDPVAGLGLKKDISTFDFFFVPSSWTELQVLSQEPPIPLVAPKAFDKVKSSKGITRRSKCEERLPP